MKNTLPWIGALLLGAILGILPFPALHTITDVVATVYTRLFQLLAVPTIVLAVVNTLVSFAAGRSTGRIFRHTLTYTLLTTVLAAAVGALLFVLVAPNPIGAEQLAQVSDLSRPPGPLKGEGPGGLDGWGAHLLSVVPNNVVRPLLDGNVLSLLLVAFAVGAGLARMPQSEEKTILTKGLQGLQELLFLLIGWLVKTLPLAIVAFAAQLSVQLQTGAVGDTLGRYVLVIVGGNLAQFFVVLPLLLWLKGLNPLSVFSRMYPAVLMALFTKSSAATLPVTMQCAEQRLRVRSEVARFVLPICTTINMNGCAAFILVTSLFIMQQGGTAITLPLVCVWVLISVVAAIGNAGVPMGCYFLTLTLMTGIGAPNAGLMGLILPVYALLDMVETAENVWSDACVCAITDRDVSKNVT